MKIEFFVPYKPFGKQRPRVTRTGHAYTPKETTEMEKIVRACWKAQSGVKLSDDKPLKLGALFQFKVPDSYSKKKKAELIGKYYDKAPDTDNLLKLIADAIQGYAFGNDSKVVEIYGVKKYAEREGTKVIIEEIEE